MMFYTQKITYPLGVLLFLLLIAPFSVSAQSKDLEVAGWIPYWSTNKGTRDAKKHIDVLSMVHPFGYTVKQDGTLNDLMGIKKRQWQSLIRTARSNNVLVIPTVMTSDGDTVHRILSDEKLRREHVNAIVSMVRRGKFDGVNIDYEGKRSDTKDYFSLFLQELNAKLGTKLLTCAIEARTPPESLYTVIPATINYANDYQAIGRHCDRVQLMTYDQRRADIKLNAEKSGEPYMPIADADWVEKVIVLALQTIPKEKLVVGIPTYGHEYEITTAPNWYRDYVRVSAVNPPYAVKTAKAEKVTPSRNKAGEASYSYWFSPMHRSLGSTLSIADNTLPGNVVASQALAYATLTNLPSMFYYVTWSDAEAVREKVDLAKKYNLRGVAFFKIDGEEDQAIWDIFENQ